MGRERGQWGFFGLEREVVWNLGGEGVSEWDCCGVERGSGDGERGGMGKLGSCGELL